MDNRKRPPHIGPARWRFAKLFEDFLLERTPLSSAKGWNNNSFSIAAGVSSVTVGNWRRGDALPETEKTFQNIVTALYRDLAGYDERKRQLWGVWKAAVHEPTAYVRILVPKHSVVAPERIDQPPERFGIRGFNPLEALSKLRRPFTPRMIYDCQLHVTQNRNQLVTCIFNEMTNCPSDETFSQLVEVLFFFRIYYPFEQHATLLGEINNAVLTKMGANYLPALRIAQAYWEFRIQSDKQPIYEKFSAIGEECKLIGDVNGYIAAITKEAYLYSNQNEAAKGQRLLSQLEANREEIIQRNKFIPFYDPIGLETDMHIARARIYFDDGNSVEAIEQLRIAHRHAHRAGILHSLGNIYEELARNRWQMKMPDKAEKHKATAISYFENYGDMERARLRRLQLGYIDT